MSDAAGATGVGSGSGPAAPTPTLPDYGGACIASLVPALAARRHSTVSWLPQPAVDAEQLVLLVLDGLGWSALRSGARHAPALSGAVGGPVTSVAPTTTATALTSIATGTTPAQHGVVGYRLAVGAERGREVMNVLRWRTDSGDARQSSPARLFQPRAAFLGNNVPALTRSEFASTGFTAAHLAGCRLVGWNVPSTIVVEVKRLVDAGEPLVYVYYDGLDKVAHQYGLGDHYQAELANADRLVSDLAAVLGQSGALVVTSDHGQVEVGDAVRLPGPDLLSGVELISGEGRFRWFHCRRGASDDVLACAQAQFGDEAWIRTRDEMVAEGWYGGPLAPQVSDRLGDVAVVAHAPVAVLDPADTGETRLMARHGSLTEAEMYVPLVALRGS